MLHPNGLDVVLALLAWLPPAVMGTNMTDHPCFTEVDRMNATAVDCSGKSLTGTPDYQSSSWAGEALPHATLYTVQCSFEEQHVHLYELATSLTSNSVLHMFFMQAKSRLSTTSTRWRHLICPTTSWKGASPRSALSPR